MKVLLTRRPGDGTSSGRATIAGRDKPWTHLLLLLLPRPLAFTILFAVIGSGSVLYGQQRNHYRFQLQGVANAAEAKLVTDILRPVFNTADEPYAVFPAFSEQYGRFDFRAELLVTREQLEAALAAHGLVLTDFSNTDDATPENEKQ